ncbi:N-end rule pathway, recognition component UBR1 [Phaffia rhodozyma]|uniref:E3 ubiquitin-protein ligase n=1 Tax=Phaffia rhodozyma TaxID=264483 RepID=A0A0F7SSK6_PHARH|nr:N-end rule pathway, recognition component UBR1 [Phaffia rhodozyma]
MPFFPNHTSSSSNGTVQTGFEADLLTLAARHQNHFTPLARAELQKYLYTTLWASESTRFLDGPAPTTAEEWSGFNLTRAQRLSRSKGRNKKDTKGKGREIEFEEERDKRRKQRGSKESVKDDPASRLDARCGKAFEKGEVIYRCRDCNFHDHLALMCSACYRESSHQDHTITLKVASSLGEFCNAGDPSMWLRPVPSSLLSPSAVSSSYSSSSSAISSTEAPHTSQEHISEFINSVFDYILTTLDVSPEETTLPTSEADLTRQERLEGVKWFENAWAVVLWNDEKHTRVDVAVQLGDAIGWTEEEGLECAERVHTEGREVIEISSSVPRLLHIAHTLAQIDLGVTLRSAHDTFRECISAYLLSFLLDLSTCSLEGSDSVLRETMLCSLMSSRLPVRDRGDFRDRAGLSRIGGVEISWNEMKRVDWAMVYHSKWWKKPRVEWGLLMNRLMLVGDQARLDIASRYALVFPRLIELYLFTDRESENSMTSVASKIFPIPSVASYLVSHSNILPVYLQLLRSYYTGQFAFKRITFPPGPAARVEPESEPFRLKKSSPLFSHLRDLISSSGVKAYIAQHADSNEGMLSLGEIFTGMNSQVRAAERHVEYETEGWTKAFQVTGELGRLARAWGEGYAHSSTQDLMSAISAIGMRLGKILNMEIGTLDPGKYQPPSFHTVRFGVDSGTEIKEWEVVQYQVESQYVSFHNPLHWVLAGLLKHPGKLEGVGSDALIRALGGLENSTDVDEKNARQRALVLLDFPLRIVVFIAQLRNSLWVRNGQSMRQQQHHYREHTALGVREGSWDNDMFLLQVFLSLLEPDLVLATFLDRFSLTEWFQGRVDHPVYPFPSAGMVEEFLSVLIVCLSEPATIGAWSTERYVRREVIHALVLGPSTYSDLSKRLPERVTESHFLHPLLLELASFKPPESATDFGLYELKDACFEEVDPLFHHFSRNQKQEVEAILEKRFKKSKPKGEYLHIPKPMEPLQNRYASLLQTYKSNFLPQIVFFTLSNLIPLHQQADKEGTVEGKARESQESVLELALHLAMLCLQHELLLFAKAAVEVEYLPGQTLVRILCSIEDEYLFKSLKARVAWCLDTIKKHFPSQVEQWRVVPPPVVKKTGQGAGAGRKQKAAARQAAIMQQFSADQKAFLDAHEDENDSMEEDETDEEDIIYGSCMVCQENCTAFAACGSLALIQPSKLIRHIPLNSQPWLEEVLNSPSSLDRNIDLSDHGASSSLTGAYPINNFKFGLHTSTCGHLMHTECFDSYIKTTENRHHAQAARNHPENVARREFNCPLCKSLGNVLLPMQNPYDRPSKPIKSDDLPLRDWLRLINTEALRDITDTSMMFQHRTDTGELPPLFADATCVIALPLEERSPLLDAAHKMLLDLQAVARPISQQSVHLRLRGQPESLRQDRPAVGMYLPDELVAHMIAGLEITYRGQESSGQTVADSLNNANCQLVKCLLGSLRLATYSNLGGKPGLVSARYGLFARLLPDWYRDANATTPILCRDPLGVVVEGAAIAYEYLQPILILAYYAELCRGVIGILHLIRSFPNRSPSQWLNVVDSDASHAVEVFGNIRQLFLGMASHSRILQFEVTEYLASVPDHVLARLLYAFTLPFVRRVSIVHKVVKMNQPSSSLIPSPLAKMDPSTSEYVRLMAHLRIPLPVVSLSPPTTEPPVASNAAIVDCVSSYLKQFSAFYGPRSQSSLIRLEYPAIYQMARIPNSLEGVFEMYGPRECANCKTAPNAMAVCLLCGEGVCVGSSCCRENLWGGAEGLGECNIHMRKCNAPIGIFLDLRKWQILWLWAGSGSWGPNIFLDTHGELDQSMKRGFPQSIHPPRLDEVRKIWLTHGVPSFVARKMEALLDGGGWGHF